MKSTRPILLAFILATIMLATAPQAKASTVADGAFCYRYDTTTLQPIGQGNTVFTYSEKIGFWVKITEPSAGEEYRIVWYDPSGTQFRQQTVTLVPKTDENWGILFDSINVAETTAKDKLGVWDVKLLIDRKEEATAQFQIIDYGSILQSLADARADIDIIQSENDLLESQNQQLTIQLQQMQADYATLQSQIGTSSDFQELQADYDDLYEQYQSLGRDLSTTRMMMYAAVVVAIASVGIAVYFGAVKKS
ncbi:hypothetical protein E2P63_08850 [Candidatus Bathyarchaeota archaeon]|nr:hypothetical protein E2P63_08850 [Candidatus Bathyarchaeota archaeon]